VLRALAGALEAAADLHYELAAIEERAHLESDEFSSLDLPPGMSKRVFHRACAAIQAAGGPARKLGRVWFVPRAALIAHRIVEPRPRLRLRGAVDNNVDTKAETFLALAGIRPTRGVP